MHRTVQAHILYIFKINRANLAKTHWGGQFSLVFQQRETHRRPFIRMASQPLLNLTSSHSPLNTRTHTHSSTSTVSLTHPGLLHHAHAQSQKDWKRKRKQPLNIIIKHVNAIFSGMPSMRKTKLIKPVSGKGSLDEIHAGVILCHRAGAPDPPRPFHCGPRMPRRLVGGRRGSAPHITNRTVTTRRLGNVLHHLRTCSAPSLFMTRVWGGLDGGVDRRYVWGRGLYSRDEPPAGRRGEAGGPIGGDQGLYGVSDSLLSRWHPEGGGWGLNVSGKVERVAFQFGKGDGRMLQIVEQHLDLRREETKIF